MDRKQFLAESQDFLRFLSNCICETEGHSFSHEYRDNKSKNDWECNSVFDAFKNYRYPIKKRFLNNGMADSSSFASNASVLNRLQSELQKHFLNCDNTNSENALLQSSKDVFDWGGVLARNGCWLDGYVAGGSSLCSLYNSARDIFLSPAPDLNKIRNDGIRSNAGFTKVYSLLFDDFIIYDSRVAATLELFVIGFCKSHNLEEIPEHLHFRWMPAKEAKSKKLRNASVGKLKFSGVNKEHNHADSNIRANWLFSELFSNSEYLGNQAEGKTFGSLQNKQEKMRALESAFFMIGYDLTGHQWLK